MPASLTREPPARSRRHGPRRVILPAASTTVDGWQSPTIEGVTPVDTTFLTLRRPGIALLGVGLASGLLAATLLGPAAAPARAQTGTDILARLVDVGTINVNGVGRVKITPDVADVQLGVTVQGETAQEASDKAAQLMDAVIAAVKGAGIAEADIQTTQLSLYPVYDYNDDPPEIEGWEASNIVSVTVRDIDAVGDVVGAATGAGATNVQGISFRVDDPSAAEAQARSAAVADARAKADQLAADAGVTIVGVRSISEASFNAPQPIAFDGGMARAEMAMDTAAPPPVLPGQTEISVTVAIQFEIE
jgi:uncharacterized protein YggE